ncbi:uncharacterized protein LOC112213679 [Bombus impatiens]|uniref:Uncharacterized protein LOC112213679 n=1 Tax=Bombus impatiens TaxID=132113 RepID=A0A6P6FHH0_BOMIM|nr:uncharacterized protein LOC112213679 [Bombus impatiens]
MCLRDRDFRDIPSNRLSRWQHIQQFKQHFWNRWHKEYLNELTNRNKWSKGGHSIQEGTIVILREDNMPSMHWPLGRVIKVHPGADGVIRTATIQTAEGVLDRAVKRLVPLPIQPDLEKPEQPVTETMGTSTIKHLKLCIPEIVFCLTLKKVDLLEDLRKYKP